MSLSNRINVRGGGTAKNVFKTFLDNCGLTTSRPNGWDTSGYTINSGSQLVKTNQSARVHADSQNTGYVTTLMSPVPIDVTRYNELVFSVNVSSVHTQQNTFFGLADNTNNGFTYTAGRIEDTVAGARSVSVDISNVSGLKYLVACNYCASYSFDFTITDIQLY